MATGSTHKEERQHKKSKKICSIKHAVRKSIFGELDKTKEYAIYWLCDDGASPSDFYELLKGKLRGIVDYLRKIPDINHIRKTDEQNVFLVLNSTVLKKHFVTLTAFKQIRSIYVYGDRDNDSKHKSTDELVFQYPQVCGPFKDLDELFSTLSKNVRTMAHQPNMVSELRPLTSASKTIERSTSATYSYVTDWYIHLIRALEEVPPARTCKEKFVEECCILYEHNPSILKTIKEFSNTYVPEDAVRWYTRDGFLYKVLNRVLREQNQQAMQVLHFLIYDLDRQLRNELRNTKQEWMTANAVRLYRGQLMSMEEVRQLRNNKGEELFVNSFLSMTTDLSVAKMFSGAGTFSPDDPMQSVIFHIEWADFNPKQGLADIQRLSFNEDEGEILLSPTYTLSLLDCVYDEKERVWNATFSRLSPTDNPVIRINDDERLMRLELTLRHLIEEKDSWNEDMEEMMDELSSAQDDDFDFTRKFCSTFVEDVPILLRELKLPELCSVALNHDHSGRFELKTLRSFTADSLDHGPKIHDDMVVILYDALGSVFKTKGKFMKAYYYYQKASMYDNSQSQTSYTRQAHLAQIHKMNGDHGLAWKIFDELMNRTEDMGGFLYEDITFARSVNMSNEVFLQNSHAFLQYCSAFDNDDDADDDDDDDDDDDELFVDEKISYVIDAWAELGYKYFYQNHDTEQALECYTREKELSLSTSKSQLSYFNPLIGSCSERMGDIYASQNDLGKALALYKEALDLSLQETFVMNVMTAARCMCKIGRYSPNHQSEIFHRAFQYLIHGYGKPYTRDTIGKCYVCLSRSLQRCERHQQAVKYAQQALAIFRPDSLLLEGLIDDCCELLIELHRSISNNGDNVPTKAKLLNDRISPSDEQIKEMLQRTLEELGSELDNK